MFRLFDRTRGAAVCVQAGEAGCVALAVEDLCNDVRRVSGLTLSTCSTPCAQGTQLIIGTLTNPAIRQWVQEHHVDVSPMEGQWEHYLMETLSETTMSGEPCGGFMSFAPGSWGLIRCIGGRKTNRASWISWTFLTCASGTAPKDFVFADGSSTTRICLAH